MEKKKSSLPVVAAELLSLGFFKFCFLSLNMFQWVRQKLMSASVGWFGRLGCDLWQIVLATGNVPRRVFHQLSLTY